MELLQNTSSAILWRDSKWGVFQCLLFLRRGGFFGVGADSARESASLKSWARPAVSFALMRSDWEISVLNDGVPADDEVPYAVDVEKFQQIGKVGVDEHHCLSLGKHEQ
ncbi:MAG: hypothetical protein HY741_14945 [Chloroflexi bacterium]|nr:hypothetical protein [Chloroflexota bacterium]